MQGQASAAGRSAVPTPDSHNQGLAEVWTWWSSCGSDNYKLMLGQESQWCKISKWDAKIQNALQQNGGYMHEQFHMGCKVNGQWVNSNAFSLWVRALALLPLSPPSPLLPWQMDFGFREALTVMYLLRTKSSKGQIETERLSPGHTETLRRWLFQYLKSCYGDGGRLNSQGKIKSSRWKCIPAFPKSFWTGGAAVRRRATLWSLEISLWDLHPGASEPMHRTLWKGFLWQFRCWTWSALTICQL